MNALDLLNALEEQSLVIKDKQGHTPQVFYKLHGTLYPIHEVVSVDDKRQFIVLQSN